VSSDFSPVREGEQLDTQALAAFLTGKLEGVESGLTLRQFPVSHSNVTCLLKELAGRVAKSLCLWLRR
jgi:hypothetical protein